MPNEELKTFINKMRAVGKSDIEITAELKAAGWAEADINQELSSNTSKTRFNLEKIKFWVWLYGIVILLFLIFLSIGFLFGSTFTGETVGLIVLIIFMIYTFGIVPIVTLLAIGFKLLLWILRFIPHFKNSKSFDQLDHKWLLVIASAVTGVIMLLVGYFQARIPNAGMATLIMGLIAVLGGILLIISFIFALVLIVVRKIVRRKKIGIQIN